MRRNFNNNSNDPQKANSLEAQLLKYSLDQIALLVIDVQKQFCDPQSALGNAETDVVAKRIKEIAPQFRAAGILVYPIYVTCDWRALEHRVKIDPFKIDFHEFEPDARDIPIAKDHDSLFCDDFAARVLKRHRSKLVLVCGVSTDACVRATVLDALDEGFDVCLLEDLTANGNIDGTIDPERTKEEIKKTGGTIEQSLKALELLHARQNTPTQYPHKPPSARPSCR